MDSPLFFDVFSGCGGMALGMMQAGWKGLFAVEKHPHAFETLRANLVVGDRFTFDWPSWLPVAPISIEDLVQDHEDELRDLAGSVTLVVGGPPCQGFSSAGRRSPDDPRNALTSHYLDVVRLVEPEFVLLENVRGFCQPFVANGEAGAYSDRVTVALEDQGYRVYADIVRADDWGVPQDRQRFIMVGIRSDSQVTANPFKKLSQRRDDFLSGKKLSISRRVSCREALSDLEVTGKKLVPSVGFEKDGFQQIEYSLPDELSPYQRLMRAGTLNGTAPNSLRLPRHTDPVKKRFQQILDECPRGKQLTKDLREHLGLKKHAITPLHPDRPSVTVTTMPDDMLHYSEPRILTARETARLQSFPDWYSIEGPYTSGGPQRKTSCPRYTQVGNAVPPLLAEALGTMLLGLR